MPGNLGFPLPQNWAFDQVKEFTLGSGVGAIHMDKNIRSGRDGGQSSVLPTPDPPGPEEPNTDFFSFLRWLQSKAHAWRTAHFEGHSVERLLCEYMRGDQYVGPVWALFTGPQTREFVEWVDRALIDEHVLRVYHYRDPKSGSLFNSQHLFATLNGYLYRGLPGTPAEPNVTDLGGWAGDLVTVLNDYIRAIEEGTFTGSILDYGLANIGAVPSRNRSFDREDVDQDIDGFNIAADLHANPAYPLADRVVDLLKRNGNHSDRYRRFWERRFDGNESLARAAARVVFSTQADSEQRLLFNGARMFMLNSRNLPDLAVLVGDYPNAPDLGDAFISILKNKGGFS